MTDPFDQVQQHRPIPGSGGAAGALALALRIGRVVPVMDPARIALNLSTADRRRVLRIAVAAAGWFTRLAAELQRVQGTGCVRCGGEGCAYCEARR